MRKEGPLVSAEKLKEIQAQIDKMLRQTTSTRQLYMQAWKYLQLSCEEFDGMFLTDMELLARNYMLTAAIPEQLERLNTRLVDGPPPGRDDAGRHQGR